MSPDFLLYDLRNQWAHANIKDWNDKKKTDSFEEMKKLAKMLPDNGALLWKLDEDVKTTNSKELGNEAYRLMLDRYQGVLIS